MFTCKDSEVLLSGPAGTGKSRACLEKLHLIALKYPNMRGLIVRKTLESMKNTALVTFREHVLPEALSVGDVTFYGGGSQESAQYRYTNGSVITMGGMDKPSRVMSSEYDVIYVQEATELTETEWQALTTRLRNNKMPYQQLIADCNPDSPSHWLKLRMNLGRTTAFDSRHEENPVLFDLDGTLTDVGAGYMAKLDNLTGVQYQRLRLGLWVAAEGIIYEEWSSDTHLIDPVVLDDSWTRYWTIDFGYKNPFVCQFWAEDYDGRLFLYREIYFTKRLAEDHARQILELVTRPDPDDENKRIWIEPKPRTIICDHDAEDRATLEKHLGLSTTAATKTVSDGIQAVQARLRVAGDGKPRIFIFKTALVERDHELFDARKPGCTSEEITGYVWDSGNGKGKKEAPVKQNDHGCDAMRYMVAELDLGGRPRIRWIG